MTRDRENGVRYWAAVGFLVRGSAGVQAGVTDLKRLLEDPTPSVRVAAAEALATHGVGDDARDGLSALLRLADARRNGYLVAVAAWNAIDNLPDGLRPPMAALEGLPTVVPGVSDRMNDYLDRLKTHLTSRSTQR